MYLNICTWFCADALGEESKYMQMRGKSSAKSFQDVYWRNIYIFYLTSKRVNPNARHYLFTNTPPPVVDGLSMQKILKSLDVITVNISFEYRTPSGYYSAWRNQFFEFSILKYISNNFLSNNYWLILDSDCVFTKSVETLPSVARQNKGILTYTLKEEAGSKINGLTQLEMQKLYSELLNKPVDTLPVYHAGEFYFSDGVWVSKFSNEFTQLWPVLLERYNKGLTRLTEEAHVLSFLYYKNSVSSIGTANKIIKRFWTQPFIFRNVNIDDTSYSIWHVPHEKRYGLSNLFKFFSKKSIQYWLNIPTETFNNYLKYQLTIPKIETTVYITRILPIQLGRFLYYKSTNFLKQFKKLVLL